MKITPKNLPRHELIGLKAKVVKSPNSSEVGIEGIIIYETMNTLHIETSRGRKIIIKKDRVFEMLLPGSLKVIVEGNVILGRPEDRLKKKLKSW